MLWGDFAFIGCDDGHLYGFQRYRSAGLPLEQARLALKVKADSAVTSSPFLLTLAGRTEEPQDKRAILAFCAADNKVMLVGITCRHLGPSPLQETDEQKERKNGEEQTSSSPRPEDQKQIGRAHV